ncbi:unnamed protein product [Zymoseptoria tritici ST99CH_3D7]|uniref:Uncharacterized protein n=1 Tax=Zymoseptoria tritici (strain ST99CH_3D7) TaxID=1276538 RepID=A0A1X7RID7_ZYMT9|nr:unnamed protein product [Zymoseptoria tritici ST99CH_3D7]
MAGGFGFSGIPETIIEYVRTRDDIDSLNMISTESGDDDWGLGRLKVNGKEYLLEESFEPAKFAWIKAWKADKTGNCIFKGTSFNYNRIMANAAEITIVEAEEIIEIGERSPESMHLPGLNVNRLFKGEKWGKIEVLKLDEGDDNKKEMTTRDVIAQRAAKEFSENGVIGVGGYPKKGEESSDCINAGKESILPIPGASTFGSDVSFGQIRGGHLDMTVLGALECSQYGDICQLHDTWKDGQRHGWRHGSRRKFLKRPKF